MNIYTKWISEWLNIPMRTAVSVQNQMAINGVDFSESTGANLQKMAWEAYKEIMDM